MRTGDDRTSTRKLLLDTFKYVAKATVAYTATFAGGIALLAAFGTTPFGLTLAFGTVSVGALYVALADSSGLDGLIERLSKSRAVRRKADEIRHLRIG